MPDLPPPNLRLAGSFQPDEEWHYRQLPFTVPVGVRALHISIEYDNRIGSNPLARGGNTLDIGLFDEAGTEAGGPGFRGWSGSELTAFTITEAWATPPYRPGPIGAGEWSLLLGPYKIGKQGLRYEVQIWFDPSWLTKPELHPSLASLEPTHVPPAAERGWVRGDLHSHSRYSDGDSWPEELLHLAAARGLDFLAITDHNGAVRATPPTHPAGRLPLLIPGTEVTTYRGHWNVWGTDSWFDFRPLDEPSVLREIGRARALGGFTSMNHPKPWGPEWSYEGLEDEFDAVEIWNGPWERLNVFPLAEWDQRLTAGSRQIAIGGSDAHYLKSGRTTGAMRDAQIGEPTTWVKIDGELTVASLLSGLRTGRVFVSVSPSGPQLYLQRGDAGVEIRVVGAAGATLELISDAEKTAEFAIGTEDWRAVVAFPPGAGYLRAQVVGSPGAILAVSNPIWSN